MSVGHLIFSLEKYLFMSPVFFFFFSFHVIYLCFNLYNFLPSAGLGFCLLFFSNSFFFFNFLNVESFLRDRDRAQAEEEQGEKDTQNMKQAPGSELSA